jgi:hypothetical protein
MRRGFLAVAMLLAVGVALYFLLARPQPGPSRVVSPASDSSASPGQAIDSSQTTASAAPAVSPPSPLDSTAGPASSVAARAGQLIVGTNAVAELPPDTVLANVRRAVRQFGEMFGGNPVGTNPEITRQLFGDNPRHINFIDPSAGMRVNGNGELVDAWDTPYFFHQISASEMEIHSAGPDKIMWTADDIVVK